MSGFTWRIIQAEFTVEQDADCCDGSQDDQTMRVKFDDGGAGMFPILRTDRWALETGEEFAAMIAELKRRVEMPE
jgi:hypothetical protein